ncbi:unnamed protein product, partial [Rotaria sordida]
RLVLTPDPRRLEEDAEEKKKRSNKSIRFALGLRLSKSCSNCIIGSSSGFNIGL